MRTGLLVHHHNNNIIKWIRRTLIHHFHPRGQREGRTIPIMSIQKHVEPFFFFWTYGLVKQQIENFIYESKYDGFCIRGTISQISPTQPTSPTQEIKQRQQNAHWRNFLREGRDSFLALCVRYIAKSHCYPHQDITPAEQSRSYIGITIWIHE